MAWVKRSTRTSSAETVIIPAADRLSATSTRRHLAHRLVSTHAVERKDEQRSALSCDSAQTTPKQEVKACHQCKGEEACRPERLSGSEIRTSGAFGAKNLYCFTVCARVPLTVRTLLVFACLEIRSQDRRRCCPWWFRIRRNPGQEPQM